MRRNAATAYAIYCAGDGFLFRLAFTVYSVFVVITLGLDPFRLLLLGTILEGTYLIFEVPTGIVADTVSRRLSIVIGLIGRGSRSPCSGSRTPSPWPRPRSSSGASSRRSRAAPTWRG